MKNYILAGVLFVAACSPTIGDAQKQDNRRLPADNVDRISDEDKAAMKEMKSYERDPEWKRDLPPSPIEDLEQGLDW